MINKTEFAKYLGITRQGLYLRFKKGNVTQAEIDEFIAYKRSHNLEIDSEKKELEKKITTLEKDIIRLKKENKQLIYKKQRIKEEKNPKREKYEDLLHRYQNASALNLEYMKRYGTIDGLNKRE